MNNAKTRLIIAVTQRLAAAPDSEAKTELIEELSENLYSRYQDMAAAGTPEDEAYQKALGELGDVEELLAYLDGLGPQGELPKEDACWGAQADPLQELAGFDWGSFARQTVDQARQAAEDAAAMMQDAANQFMGGPHTFHIPTGSGSITINRGDIPFNASVDVFQTETDDGTIEIPSEKLGAVNVSLNSGDVRVYLDNDPAAPVRLSGDTEELQLSVDEAGDVLLVRQGKTASGRFFFGRSMRSTDIELYLPRRRWESLSISTASGEVEFDCVIEAGALNVSTSSGDIYFTQALDLDCLNVATDNGDVEVHQLRAECVNLKTLSGDADFMDRLDAGTLNAVTASGDLDLHDARVQTVNVRTASGDLSFHGGQCGQLFFQSTSGDFEGAGNIAAVRACTTSGDVELRGSGLESISCTSSSGSLDVRTDHFPKQLELLSKSGDCSVTIPDNDGFTLQFRTVSGELSSTFPLVGPVGGRSGTAQYKSGGPAFRMSSISGELELNML